MRLNPQRPNVFGKQSESHALRWSLGFPSIFKPHKNVAIKESNTLHIVFGIRKMLVVYVGIAKATVQVSTSSC